MIQTRSLFFVLAFALIFVFSGCDIDWPDHEGWPGRGYTNAEMVEKLRNEMLGCGQTAHRNRHFEAALAVYASEYGRSPTIPASVTLANLVRDKHLACIRRTINSNLQNRDVVAHGVIQQEDSGRVLRIFTGTISVNYRSGFSSGPAALTESSTTDALVPPRSTTFTFTRTY